MVQMNFVCQSRTCWLFCAQKFSDFCIDFVYTKYYINEMDAIYFLGDEGFVWNENKAKSNKRKHGVSFEEACEAFFDPFHQLGEASSENEYREFVLGFS